MGGAELRSSAKHFCNYLKAKLLNTKLFCVASVLSSLPFTTAMKADTGASKHFAREADIPALQKVTLLKNGPKAKLPDNNIICATRQGFLPLTDELSDLAKYAVIYPDLKMLHCCQ